mmetsp:Transcript_46675/g.50349  ORF Transcript_46675/g.50349 Transcript_46675/m.50349 type:complete len:139 (+) Transcript_46675:123-539(+)
MGNLWNFQWRLFSPEGHGDTVPSDEDFTHEDQQIPVFEDACDDLSITTVEEYRAYSTTFCNTYGVDDIYMSTFHYKSGDSGPKYCVVKCTEGKAQWEICGTSSGGYSHPKVMETLCPQMKISHMKTSKFLFSKMPVMT